VIIDGSGVLSLTVSGNNLWRVFTIFNISDPNIQAMLANMSIVNGYANNVPGGIWNQSLGTVTLDNVIVKGNVGGFGGGVSNERGVLLVHSSTFINNSAGGGGGIYNENGTLVISDSYFRGNEASSLGGGVVSGGFSFATKTVVSNTIFVDNMASYGGGIFSNAVLTLTNSTFSHNLASVYGGGMLNNGEMIISHTTFFSNTAGHSGGAINNGNSLLLYDSTFKGNSAIQNGGAIVNFGTGFFSATVTATNSLFQENMAGYGGGVANWTGDKVTVSNSTFSSNTAITAGGGISNSMMLQLNNVTLSDNEAAEGGGIASGGTMTMSNSIIANSVGGDCANSGLFTVNVHNLVEDGSCSPMVSGDPLLGPLADNGGTTWTYALLPGSPAIDAGDAATCELADQRGVVRPIDGNWDGTAVCDIGAVEQEFTPTVHKLFLPLMLKP
jgi:predicted outer membrane repeat protein